MGRSRTEWVGLVVFSFVLTTFVVNDGAMQAYKEHTRPAERMEMDGDDVAVRSPPAAVCWVGTVEDWPDYEENTVLANVLEPLVEAGYALDVYLIAQDASQDMFPAFREPYSFVKRATFNASIYKNEDPSLEVQPRTRALYQQPGDWAGLPPANVPPGPHGSAADHAVKAFAFQLQQWMRLKTNATTGVHLREYAPIMNPPVPPEYFKALTKRDAVVRQQNATDGTIDYRAMVRSTWRVVNHLRHLHALSVCGELLNGRGGLREGGLLLRVGEDAKLVQKIPVSTIRSLQPRQMLVLPCRSHRGLEHDQVDILVQDNPDSNVAYQALTKPYHIGLFGEATQNVSTVAEFLRMIYQSLNVTILVPGTTTTTNAMAISSDWKDQASLGEFSVLAETTVPDAWSDSLMVSTSPVEYPISDEPYLTQSFSKTGSAAATTNNATAKSALICITGQLQRIELDNKIENLLLPMYEEYQSIDVVIVAYTGKAHFQPNKGYGATGPSAFATKEELVAFFNKSNNRTSFINNVTLKFFEPPEVPVNPQYMLMNAQNYGRKSFFFGVSSLPETNFFTRFEKNSRANVRMMESYQHCYSEQDKSYDLYVRLRDDVGFTAGRIPPALYNDTRVPPGAYLTHADRSNGGINDRMAFVNGREAALCYFHMPYVTMFNGKPLDKFSPNTECYFKRLYWLSNGCLHKSVAVWDRELHPSKMHGTRFVNRRMRQLR